MPIGNRYSRDIYSLPEILAHRNNLNAVKEVIINPLYDEEDMLKELDFFFIRLDNPSVLTHEQLDELQKRYDAFMALEKKDGKNLILERLKSVKQSGHKTYNTVNRKIHERWVANFDTRLTDEDYYFELSPGRENTFFLYENKGSKKLKDYQLTEKMPGNFKGIASLGNDDKAYFRRVLGEKLFFTKGLKVLAYVEQVDGTVSVAPLKSSVHHMLSGAASRGAGIIVAKPNEDGSYTVIARGLNSGAWCMTEECKSVTKVFSGNEIFMPEYYLKCLEIPSNYDPYAALIDEEASCSKISPGSVSKANDECFDENNPSITQPASTYECEVPTPVGTMVKEDVFSKAMSPLQENNKINHSFERRRQSLNLPSQIKNGCPHEAKPYAPMGAGKLAARQGIFKAKTSQTQKLVSSHIVAGRRLSSS